MALMLRILFKYCVCKIKTVAFHFLITQPCNGILHSCRIQHTLQIPEFVWEYHGKYFSYQFNSGHLMDSKVNHIPLQTLSFLTCVCLPVNVAFKTMIKYI